jgi:hypothetical protein
MMNRKTIQSRFTAAEAEAEGIFLIATGQRSEAVKAANDEMIGFMESRDIEGHRAEAEALAAAGALSFLTKAQREAIAAGDVHDWKGEGTGAKFNKWLLESLPESVLERSGTIKNGFKGNTTATQIKRIGQAIAGTPKGLAALEAITGGLLRNTAGPKAASYVAEHSAEVAAWIRQEWPTRSKRHTFAKDSADRQEAVLLRLRNAAAACKKAEVNLDDARLAFTEGFETSPAASEESRAASDSVAVDIVSGFVSAVEAEQEEAAADME